MRNSISYIAALLLLSTLGCSPTTIIGHYSNSSNNKIAFAGKEFSLEKDGTFKLNEWTDSYSTTSDENGEIHCDDKGKGIGKYTIRKDTIELYFENNDFLSCSVKVEEKANSYELDVEMTDELSSPLQGSTIIVSTKDKKIIRSKLTDENGKGHLDIEKKMNPLHLTISTFGAKDLIIPIPTNLGKSEHALKRCLGYYENKEVEKMWFKAGRTYLKYKKGKQRMVKLVRVK